MAVVSILWESEEEKTVVQALMLDWTLYGQMHLTNAHGLTRLDPRGITYRSPADPDAECGFVYTHGSGYKERCTRLNREHPYPDHGNWKREGSARL